MRFGKFVKEIIRSPYYRRHPVEAVRFGYAKYLFARFRVSGPLDLMATLNIDPDAALAGMQRWLPLLEVVARKVQCEENQGGVSVEDGIVLYGLTRALRPHYVIETGVAAGVSTSFIGAAVLENVSG